MSTTSRDLEKQIYAILPGVRLGWIGADNTPTGRRYVVDYDGVAEEEIKKAVHSIVGENAIVYVFRKDINNG